jgi:hypothetical protein
MTIWLGFLGCGCGDGGQPIAPPNIDPALVKSMKVEPYAPGYVTLITDATVIARCLAELNGLAYRPGGIEKGGPGARVTLLDEKGDVIAKYGIAVGNYIMVELPGRQGFYVKFEDMPTLGRLMSYAFVKTSIDTLQRMAGHAQWDSSDRMRAETEVDFVNVYRPDAAMPVPTEPSEVPELLKQLPDISLDNLDKFADYFEVDK